MRVRGVPPASGVGTADAQVVPGRLDLDVVLAPTDDHGLPQHVLPDDRAVALDRLDRRPDGRQRPLELDVRLVLVAQTALEPPAHAGELRGVERQRSEEHTSELQSRLHLVCRLLLEKKKNTPRSTRTLLVT